LMLKAESYPPEAFVAWEANMQAFAESDVFTFRPPEQGVDVDGVTKPIIEMCPTPRLGRYLVLTGYELLVEHITRRQRGAR